MANFIELSSSPLRVAQPGSFARCLGQSPTCRVDKVQERTSHFSSDEFNSSIFDEPDWFLSQSSKRRKLSHPEKENQPPSPSLPRGQPEASCQQGGIFSTSNRSAVGASVAETQIAESTSFAWEEHFLSDPIFTSSAPEARTSARDIQQKDGHNPDDISDLEPFSLSQPVEAGRGHFSKRTANLLANIVPGLQNNTFKRDTTKYKQPREHSLALQATVRAERNFKQDNVLDSSPPDALTRKGSIKQPGPRNNVENRNSKAERAMKDRDRNVEKERKRQAKEQKVKEKQLAADIAEVNKSKTDKKNSTPEMILDVASSLQDTSVGNQVAEYMKQLGVQCHFPNVSPENYPTVSWRRKVSSRFDEDLGHWVPAPERIDREKHVLVHILAQTFVDIATTKREDMLNGNDRTDLETHVANVKRGDPLCKPIYLIEGLTAWMRKNRNAQNRAYQAAVRGQAKAQSDGPPPSSQQSQSRQKRSEKTTTIDEDLIEDALLQLQVAENCLVHQTTCASDSAYWIKNFTEHISTIPYRREHIAANEATAFCMDIGQVKTGEDGKDTYVKMLQEVQRVTPAMAYGIASEYPTVRALIGGFKKHGPDMLQDVKKSANKDGAVSDTRLGPKVSKRLFKVFTGVDPASTDGIA
ncbi:MAG: hypothetical protein Q9160_008953 [Pyrenula sp. 1 TL-2023]